MHILGWGLGVGGWGLGQVVPMQVRTGRPSSYSQKVEPAGLRALRWEHPEEFVPGREFRSYLHISRVGCQLGIPTGPPSRPLEMQTWSSGGAG